MDMISNLPPNIIETVLCFLPIEEAARTSILSREWRYRWNKIPKLVFKEAKYHVSYDVAESSVVEQTVNGSSNRQIMFRRKKFFSAVSQAVLMHEGPIHEFTLFMLPDDAGDTYVEIDCIIFHLSRKHTVKKLTIDFEGIYMLPYSLFSFSHLSDLCLVGCCFSHKPTFNGFGKLTSLSLDGVYISTKILLHLLSSCPLLKNVTLEINSLYILMDENTTIINLFESLRMIESLFIPFSILESFVHDRTPRELPALLSHLKYFYTREIPFIQKVGLSFLVLLIRNSPNLEKLEIDNSDLDQDDSSMEDDLCTEDEIYSFITLNTLHHFTQRLRQTNSSTSSMSAYKGHRGPNVSQYIANLNQLSPPQDLLADPVPVEEDFTAFLNADFFDVNNRPKGAVDFNAPIDFDVELDVNDEQPLQAKPDRAPPRNSISDTSANSNMDFSLNSDFQFTDFNNFAANPILETGMQNLPQAHSNHYPLPPAYGLSSTGLSPISDEFDQASKKRKIDDVVPATPQHLDENARVAAEEDKRRRNTAASARFRVKKKQREQALEKTAKDMSDKVNLLEARIQQLETENAWLKGLITEKNGGKSTTSELVARLSKHEEASTGSSRNKNTDGVGTKSPGA